MAYLKNLLLISLLSVMSGTASANADEMVIIGEDRRPWLYFESDRAKGLLYDVMADILTELDHEPRLYLVPFKRSYAKLLSGLAHFSMMPLPSNPEARETVLSNLPPELLVGEEVVFKMPIVAIALKSRRLQPNSTQEVLQLRLGHERLLPYLMEATDASQYSEYENSEMQLKALMSDRIDIAITAEPIFRHVVKRLGLGSQLEVVYTLGHHNTHLIWSAIALGAKHQSLPAKAEEVLKRMKARGRVAEIINTYSDIRSFSNYQ